MILGIFSVMLPNASATVTGVTVTPASGIAGTSVTVDAPAASTFTVLRSVFGMFDTEVSDADDGLPLFAFITAAAVGDEMYHDLNGVVSYEAGEPIYRVNAAPLGNVKPGDTRLTAVTKAATVYAAGSTVAVTDLDIADALLAMPAAIHHTGVATGFAVGDEIVNDMDANNWVTSGDQRLTYPNTVVVNDEGSWTYPANSLVRPQVYDFQEGLYVDVNGNGVLDTGDSRRREYVASDVTYGHGLPIVAGDLDIGAALLGFTTAYLALDEVYVDLDNNLAYTYGEPVYTVAGVTWVVAIGDTRQSFVTVGDAFYVPGSAVLAGDADIGGGYRHFSATEQYRDVNGDTVFSYPDWIYDAAGAVVAIGDTRLSDVPISMTYNLAGTPLPAVNQAQAQVFGIGIANVAAHDADVVAGFALVAIPATWHYVGAAYLPNSPMYIDNDGDNLVSVGDTRLTAMSTGIGYPSYAALPVAAPGAWFMPGSTVAAGNAGIGTALTVFGAAANDPTDFLENILLDGVYSTELMVHYNSDAAGFMGPFPVPLAPRADHVAMTFTIPAHGQYPAGPSHDGRGNHGIMLLTDAATVAAGVAPYNVMGFMPAAAYPAGGAMNAMTSLPWTPGTAATRRWTWADMLTDAGPALPKFLLNYVPPVELFLHPGVADPYKLGWSHTLDTYWGTQGVGLASFTPNGAAPMPPGTPSTNPQTREVFDHYLDYAILASASDSVGDLQFDVTVLVPINSIRIYVPPEFRWLAATPEEAVWTDITNDYQYINLLRNDPRNAYDLVAPNWYRVDIDGNNLAYWGPLVIEPGLYHIRFFNLAAPSVAGLYHFKVYVNGVSIGAGNYPIIIVKSELNPAWIEVTVRTNLGFTLPFVSGSVLAEGTTPEGRAVSAVGYWGPVEWIGDSFVAGQMGAMYRLFLFGVAEGTYTLTAEASGFNPTTTDRITVYAGQSYTIFIVIYDSPDVHVTVWSKHGTGAIPWGNLWQLPYGTNNPAAAPNLAWPWRDMLLNLYDSEGNLIGWWASSVNAGAPKQIPLSNTLVGLHDDSGCIPTANQYNAWLLDNYDVLGPISPRGYPSTHWDGHVPWDTADYIAGMPNAQYTVEAYVTGYIMDETDAYQRTFTLSGTAIALQFDLRRTNWIETSMHLPANVFISASGATVVLTAEDAAGSERGAAAFVATTAMSLNGVLDGIDASAFAAANLGLAIPAYAGGIVIEGWNAVFPNVWDRSYFRDDNMKDYGLNPTASTHSAGTVTLAGNPYTVKLYMSDMGEPPLGIAGTGWYNIVGGDPQVSVFLCNSPQLLSFSIVNAWLWISLRSVDFQVPAHSRPWTFPASVIYVEFLNEAGEQADVLDPSVYGLIQDAGRTNAFVAGTAGIPAGTGFPIVGAAVASRGVSPFDVDNINAPGQHEHIGVRYYGTDFTAWYGIPLFRALIGLRPTRLPAGAYTYAAHTHGYVQRNSFPVQVPSAGGADIEADLIQGGQIRVVMNFNHEGVATNFNGFVRVEVFNANEELVGASIYGQAEPNLYTSIGMPSGGYRTYDWIVDAGFIGRGCPGPAQGAGFGFDPVAGWNGLGAAVPYGIANPGGPWAVFPSSSRGQRAVISGYYFYNVPNTLLPVALQPPVAVPPTAPAVNGQLWRGWDNMDPSDANRLALAAGNAQAFDIYGFYWYYGGPARTWAGGWPTTDGFRSGMWNGAWDSGIKGTVDIPGWEGSGGGLYSVKVWAFDPRGPNGAYEAANPTDDWRMYSMGSELNNIEVPWGGSQELFVTMNNMATLRGTVAWLDMFGNYRPLPWAQITASPGPATDTVPAYSSGIGSVGPGASDPSGAYIMWLPAGTHSVSVSTSEAPQVWSSSAPTQNAEYTVVVSDGWVGGGDTRLGTSGTAIPEVPAFMAPLALIAALAASVWLLRRRNLNIPVWIK